MPKITLDIPSNTRFSSSLNEIDIGMKSILINVMRKADPRNKLQKQNKIAEKEEDYLWDKTRVFQVDDLTIEEIFDTYLLRKNINGLKGTDISYPLLAYKQDDISTVFWGTGNRYHQHFIETDPVDNWEVDDEVAVVKEGKYRGLRGIISSIKDDKYTVAINGKDIEEKIGYQIIKIWFSKNELRMLSEDKRPGTYKAKGITTKYQCVVLADNRDEIQYIRDHFILRVADSNVWWTYNSPTINNSENQIFTVFGIPNIEKYPTSDDKLKKSGYIYGTSFVVDTWAALTDKPLTAGFIEGVRLSLTVEPDGRSNRIIIDGN